MVKIRYPYIIIKNKWHYMQVIDRLRNNNIKFVHENSSHNDEIVNLTTYNSFNRKNIDNHLLLVIDDEGICYSNRDKYKGVLPDPYIEVDNIDELIKYNPLKIL